MKAVQAVLIGGIVGAILGATSFGTIAAVTPGGWTTLESTVIGLWLGAVLGAFFGLISQT